MLVARFFEKCGRVDDTLPMDNLENLWHVYCMPWLKKGASDGRHAV